MDISRCNQFLASAGKDAQIIIWDLSSGRMLFKLQSHANMINRIQFHSPRSGTKDGKTAEPLQFLLSCSDDGTVRLYDFTQLCCRQGSSSRKASDELNDFKVRRSSRQRTSTESESSSQPYSIELTPEDFRPGVRNKKLDTLALNHQGLVVAGSNTGEMFVWRVNYQNLARRLSKNECVRFLGQYKLHKNSGIQFCEFSPRNGIPGVGDHLMTGSTDGIVKIWKMQVGTWRQGERDFSMDDKSRLWLEIDENRGCLETVCSPLEGSDSASHDPITYQQKPVQAEGQIEAKLKYQKSQCDAVRWSVHGRFAISSITSQVEKSNDEECHIKIWDTVEQTFFDDLARYSGQPLRRNTWVLAPHPEIEEILMTGSDGGVLILWNMRTKQMLKQFFQSGVYSIDAFVMDNPLDGKWSPDGKAFIVGNQLGTISFYTNENKRHQYQATRVQQFFQFDIERQPENPFQKITDRPSICGYNMVPYEVQPAKLMLRFTDCTQTPKEFSRNHVLGIELGRMEEQYYHDQLVMGSERDPMVPLVSSLPASQVFEQPSQGDPILREDESFINTIIQNEQPRQPQRRQAQPRHNTRMRRAANRPPRQSSPAPEANYASDDGTDQRELQSDAEMISEDDDVVEDELNFQESENDDEGGSEDSQKSLQSEDHQQNHMHSMGDRAQRAARRNHTNFSSVSPEQRDRQRGMVLRRRLQRQRAQQYGDGESSSEEESKQTSRNTRRQQAKSQNRTSNRRSHQSQPQSGQQTSSMPAQMSSSDSPDQESQSNFRRPKRRRRLHQDDSYEVTRPVVDTEHLVSCYMSENELENEDNLTPCTEQNMLLHINDYSEVKAETNYFLVREPSSRASSDHASCELCKRDDKPLVGPFKLKDSLEQDQIWLHQECIEINTYSYYRKADKKWVNLQIMLKALLVDQSYICYRCDRPGASISCVTCRKCFHGFRCSSLYLIPMTVGDPAENDQATNPNDFQCLFCRNQDNFQFHQEQKQNSQKNYMNALRVVKKDHLLRINQEQSCESKQQYRESYHPQVDDLVYYFFQGHEAYIYNYNCHFFAGQTRKYPISLTMPWLNCKLSSLRFEPLVLCRVLAIRVLFPSERSFALMNRYGRDSSEVIQQPKMIQRITLQIVKSARLISHRDAGLTFTVDLFPNQLADFLVLSHVYDAQFKMFLQKNLEGERVQFKTKKGSEQVIIVQTQSPIEPTLYPNSQWQNVIVRKMPSNSMNSHVRSRQRAEMHQQEFRINFWEIVFGRVPEQIGLRPHEHTKILNALDQFMRKKHDYLLYFADRVQLDVAKDYRVIIGQEMWFDLLKQRIDRHYYRTQRQLTEDLEQIRINAEYYNGKDHEIAQDASQAVRLARHEIIKCIDEQGDSQLRQRIAKAQVFAIGAPNFSQDPTESHSPAVRNNQKPSTFQEVQIDTGIAQAPMVDGHLQEEEELKEISYLARSELEKSQELTIGKRMRKDEEIQDLESTVLDAPQKHPAINNQSTPVETARRLRKRNRVM